MPKHKNIDEAVDAMFQIERALLRRNPAISQWAGYHMAHKGKWYFAYQIDGDTITVRDASTRFPKVSSSISPI